MEIVLPRTIAIATFQYVFAYPNAVIFALAKVLDETISKTKVVIFLISSNLVQLTGAIQTVSGSHKAIGQAIPEGWVVKNQRL